ncbi:DUF4381 domain-containing protein [Mesorhizobium sp. LHD-90]|uniref:DUF4381 domain-containing protein n=1 Tax=Mesorhizobium sp. LHD-90 TaxID=3071414 RepID=UPI0027E0746F|nr:DUF4381 domain-containing protein [Mesorhizobium sp. LHD-90]MDQ6436595.1 DUF4381 domain-containing protein [Mesorhizobium sp. LHD-90]
MDADAAPQLDAATRAALQKLADIAQPPLVSWMPQTWGWAVLAVLVAALLFWGAWRWHRHRVRNRYRREALAELARIEAGLGAPEGRADAVAEAAALLKRVALAAWPRETVASLSGPDWVAFLRKTAGGSSFPDAAAALLDDAEYRGPPDRAVPKADEKAFLAAARRWIEGHHVPA